MKIPFYSAFKTGLENKGLDTTTSGRIAWFVFSALVSFFIGLFLSLFISSMSSVFQFPGVFLFYLFFIFLSSFFLLLSLYKRFFFINLFYILIYIIMSNYDDSLKDIIHKDFVLWSIVYPFIWFFYRKTPLGFRFLFFFVYCIFMFCGYIIFLFVNGYIRIG